MKTATRLLLILALFVACLAPVRAQTGGSVGIGTTTLNASAALDIAATSKGLLVPRLDSVQRVAIAAPATGLLVFQTAPRRDFYYYSGYGSGYNNTTGSNNWAFGYNAGPTTGNLTNAGAIGFNATVSQSNSLALGGTGAAAVRVGIGTGSPTAQLEVQLPSTSGAASLKLEHRGSNLIVRSLNGGNAASIIENTAGNLLLEPSGQGNVGINQINPTYRLDVGGSIYASGAIISLSDARFKTQVRPLTNVLASVQRLRGVRYQLNAQGLARGGEAGEQVGLLAQELEQVYPELVRTDAQGYKAINYAQLTPVLLEAIRKLAAENVGLRQQAAEATQRAQSAEDKATLAATKAAAAEANPAFRAAPARAGNASGYQPPPTSWPTTPPFSCARSPAPRLGLFAPELVPSHQFLT